MKKNNKKLLMVTVGFPPRGGGGVQRNVKFLKYLTRLGWQTNVLTIKDSSFFVKDHSLLEEIKETSIFRSNSWDPITVTENIKNVVGKNKAKKQVQSVQTGGSSLKDDAWYATFYRKLREFVMLPDAYGGWIPFAYFLGKRIVKIKKPTILFASFPGASNAIITYKLSKKFKIPYIIDFRDAWVDDPYVTYPSRFHKKLQAYYEKKIVTGASRVVVYGDVLKAILEQKYPAIIGKVDVITNGFDPEDLEKVVPKDKDSRKVRIVYSGAVSFDRKANFYSFIDALQLLSKEILERLEVIFVGKKYEWAFKLVNEKGLSNTVSFTGYLKHEDSLNYLASANAALLFLAKGDLVAFTGKVFEYVGLKLPILACIEKEGVCAKMLTSINHDQGVCDPSSAVAIAEKIKILVQDGLPRLEGANITAFSRKEHSLKMDKILSSILKLQ